MNDSYNRKYRVLERHGIHANALTGMSLYSFKSSVCDHFPFSDVPPVCILENPVSMQNMVYAFSPLFHDLVFRVSDSELHENELTFNVLSDVRTVDELLSLVDYRPFVEHIIPKANRNEDLSYAECDDFLLCMMYDERLLSLCNVRGTYPVLHIRIFPKNRHFRFTDGVVSSLLRWFCDTYVRLTNLTGFNSESIMFHMEVTMPEIWFSDVTCMHMTERKAAIRKYPVWLRHDCIVRERVFSQIGFSLRQLLALMYPDMHESYVRTSAACDVSIGMMQKLGFVLAQELQCASYTLDVTPTFALGI